MTQDDVPCPTPELAAAVWLDDLRGATPEQWTAFSCWLAADARHAREFMEICALDSELRKRDPSSWIRLERAARTALAYEASASSGQPSR